jgi:glyoxylase-like metal-dependent hydrolase (beta-lactamase superfamily II)/rhodanese-related sulfurtransferase
MFFRQYYLGCLSHASYLIGDETSGRAVVVDPQRDIGRYLADAEANGLRIERVIETHFHADFLSGHLELADRTGAVITYGEAAVGRASYPIDAVPHGTRWSLGEVTLEVRATPGHTPESVSIVVWEHPDDSDPYGVLTGDTLFIGDVGRPDLLASAGVTADSLARDLYHSLHTQLLTLPDATRVFPAHGAGSACGKHLSSETESTIGEQRRGNYALAPMTEDEFVAVVTEGQPAAPLYFAFDAGLNREQRPLLDEEHPPPALSLDDVQAELRRGAAVVDTREMVDFAAGHLRGSVNVPLSARFAEYVGDVVRAGQSIVLVSEPGTALEAKVRLARIGFDRVMGTLDSPLESFLAHPDDVVASSRLSVGELATRLEDLADLQVIDVRNPSEVEAGTVPGAIVVPLPRLLDGLVTLDPVRPTVVYCASGLRSFVAASVLSTHGFTDVSDLLGGSGAWTSAGLPTSSTPTTTTTTSVI